MKANTIIIVGVVLAPILFAIGFDPAEGLLTSGKPDSHVLIGTARLALLVCGACEFVIGAALATGVCMLVKRASEKKRYTETDSATVIDHE